MKLSVLMSIYHKEKIEYFNQAMKSIWDDQTVKPTEIVLVEDGKLTDELYKLINNWENRLGTTLKRVPLVVNQGLGKALNIGLSHCQYDYVARMDTDDISTPDRFEKQIGFLTKNTDIDILGGQIEEFETQIDEISLFRRLPTQHNNIVQFAKLRCPFNHPTVIYRKSTVLKAGGYQDDFLYEDYALWVRMIHGRAKTANLSDTILYMRGGSVMFERRGGLKYAISEVKVQYRFYKMGFLSFFAFARNVIVRFPIRIMPNRIRAYVYTKLLRSKM